MDDPGAQQAALRADRSSAATLWVAVAGLLLGGFFLLGLLSIGGAGPLPPTEGTQSTNTTAQPLNTTAAEQAIREAVNRERVARGVAAVEAEGGIAAVARNHSRDMIARGYYAHESPDGETPLDRIDDGPASCEVVGENIAATWWHQPFEAADGGRDRHTTVEELADGVAKQWLSSSSHRENMLDPRWERTGVGVAVTKDGEVLVTQNFCS